MKNSSLQNEMSALSDRDLLDAWCSDQEPAALGALVQRYSVMVLSVCRRRCRSESDAEDGFQTTFLYLARNGHKIRDPLRLAGWLQKVAQRAAVATMKNAKRETEPMLDPPVDPDDPLDRLTQRHEAIVLDEELADLPEHYRAAIVMHLYDGHSLQHLAEHFQTTVGSIRGRLQRAKQLLARRLRQRGVVPALAMASGLAWKATPAQAAAVATPLIASIDAGELPDLYDSSEVFDTLLSQGTRSMTWITSAVAGLIAGSLLLAMIALAGMPNEGSPRGSSINNARQLTFPGTASDDQVLAQFAELASGGLSGGGGGTGFGGETPPASFGQASTNSLVWTDRIVAAQPTSETAVNWIGAMEENQSLQTQGNLYEAIDALRQISPGPILMDERGLDFAKIKAEELQIEFVGTDEPLQTMLRRMLSPFGLKGVVENEGLVITADMALLVHQGIGTDRWINVEEDAATKIATSLHLPTTFDLIEAPLSEVVEYLSESSDLTIVVDQPSLEDIGSSLESPVTLRLKDVKLRTALNIILKPYELTYTINGEVLTILSHDANEKQMLNRIYWLEGTGLPQQESATLIESIQVSIAPDSWEVLGGPSTIVPLGTGRPAILVSTTYTNHEEIERFLKALRETHFGNAPEIERVQVPGNPALPGGIGGGGMGGGGFF